MVKEESQKSLEEKAIKKIKKAKESIANFLKAYRELSIPARAAFEQQINIHVADADENTKKLYQALISSARRGLSVEETFKDMEKIEQVDLSRFLTGLAGQGQVVEHGIPKIVDKG